jgi:ADP-ribosyl-[dinitrogen reductase] hydrolase
MKNDRSAVISLIRKREASARFHGCLLGLAVGDAVGTTAELRPRGTFEPLADMVGGGPFRLESGQWTDDTSMALCLATSLVERNGFDPADQMERYCRWAEEGYLSSTGACFDIGVTTAAALRDHRRTGKPYSGSTDPLSAGNGSIMRLAPIPMFFLPDFEAIERFAAASSMTTHGAPECVDACRLFGRVLGRALLGSSKESVLFGDSGTFGGAERTVAIARGNYKGKSELEIRGTGYVAESFEAALWCFLRTDTFEQAILTAANLGDDADTTAAVCGQVAGAWYGVSGIPPRWLEKLALRSTIADLAAQLLAIMQARNHGR